MDHEKDNVIMTPEDKTRCKAQLCPHYIKGVTCPYMRKQVLDNTSVVLKDGKVPPSGTNVKIVLRDDLQNVAFSAIRAAYTDYQIAWLVHKAEDAILSSRTAALKWYWQQRDSIVAFRQYISDNKHNEESNE